MNEIINESSLNRSETSNGKMKANFSGNLLFTQHFIYSTEAVGTHSLKYVLPLGTLGTNILGNY